VRSSGIEPLAEFAARYGLLVAILGLTLAIVAVAVRSQRIVRDELYRYAGTLGWEARRKPAFAATGLAVRGSWQGRPAALVYHPPSKSSPAYLTAEIGLPAAGRFEIRSKTPRGSFLSLPIVVFGPPTVDLFDPEDAARLRAWADDRSLVDRLLAIPGIRPRLETNLAGGGVLTLRKGRLRLRRRVRADRSRGFQMAMRLGPDLEKVRRIAAEEWSLVSSAAALGPPGPPTG
jgi:hypothetical protein